MKLLTKNECITQLIIILKKLSNYTEPRNINNLDLQILLNNLSWKNETEIFLQSTPKEKHDQAILAVSIDQLIGSGAYAINLLYKEYIPEEYKLEYLLASTSNCTNTNFNQNGYKEIEMEINKAYEKHEN